jgi:hypothetical protein
VSVEDRPLRPAEVCRGLLAALEASEGRRRKRKRDTRPDAIGLDLKRRLLEAAVREDPDPEGFEGWLVERCGREAVEGGEALATGPARAMAVSLFEEWRLARSSSAFRGWLASGAPSGDADEAVSTSLRDPEPGQGGASGA